MTVPAKSTEIVGDAAETCSYDDPQTLTCTLKEGLKFSNGDDLTSSDVKYSFERSIKIQDAERRGDLPARQHHRHGQGRHRHHQRGRDRDPDDPTVVFHLDHADTTFQYVLPTPAPAAIVDEDVFPADTKLADEQIIGSGPYKLSQYKAGEQAVLEVNDEYTGENTGQSPQVFVKYYSEPSALKLAAENGEVDVAWRSLSPTDIADLKGNDDVTVATGEGSEIRYWVWQHRAPGRQAARRSARRSPRSSTATRSPRTPTTAPSTRCTRSFRRASPAQKDSFKEKYGEPDVAKAKKILDDAGIQTPVDLTLGWTPTHYGPSTEDEANEVKRQLEDSGLFTVT